MLALFQLHKHTLPYPKTKEKEKLPEIKKYRHVTATQTLNGDTRITRHA